MPHARFNDLYCLWPPCGFRIWFIDFRLELQHAKLYREGVAAWEKGCGLVGRCPACSQKILFKGTGKFRVEDDKVHVGAVILPEDWFECAIL
jgi:hypothetical protein